MKTIFETDEFGLIIEFPTHDAIFEKLEFSDSCLSLTIRKKECIKRIVLTSVRFLQVMELVPNGIVLSCYSFQMIECPEHLKSHLCFSKATQFLSKQELLDINVFYIDGTMGFDLFVCHKDGRVEDVT